MQEYSTNGEMAYIYFVTHQHLEQLFRPSYSASVQQSWEAAAWTPHLHLCMPLLFMDIPSNGFPAKNDHPLKWSIYFFSFWEGFTSWLYFWSLGGPVTTADWSAPCWYEPPTLSLDFCSFWWPSTANLLDSNHLPLSPEEVFQVVLR